MLFILETKINTPVLTEQTTFRSRLIDKLNESIGKKLTILSAPAGFGKSTLLCQWLENQNLDAAWFSIDEGDNNLNRFITYVIKAIQVKNIEIGNASLNIIQSQQKQPSVENILGYLINDIVKHRHQVRLVLDDYHLIKINEIHYALTYLLDHMPNNLHLYLLTRSDPPLLLSRMRGQKQIVDIRASDLSFNFTESSDFFSRNLSQPLSQEHMELLNIRTEGWIAGLQMAAISMQGKTDVTQFINNFSNSNRFMLDYLIEEVFHNQTEDIQNYLMKTSILTRLNDSLCSAVTLQDYSHIRLDHLIKNNLLILRLDKTGDWYRYHHLFSDLLYKLALQYIPDQIKDLHKRASQWYQHNNLTADAIDHALKAEDFGKAEKLISQMAERLWLKGGQGIILEWIKKFPEKYQKSDPRLCAFLALMVFLDGRYARAEEYIQLAEINSSKINDQEFKGVIDAIRSYIADYRGRIEEALEYGSAAFDSLTDKYAIWRSLAGMALGDVYTQKGPLIPATEYYREAIRCGTIAENNYCKSLAQHRYVVMLHRRGRLEEAFRLVEQFICDPYQITNPSGALYLIQGELLYEFNQLDKAMLSLHKALQLCEEQHHAAALPYCHAQLARIYLAQNNHSQADIEAQRSMELLRQHDLPHWVVSFVIASQIDYALKNGNLFRAEALLSDQFLPLPCQFLYPNETEYLVYARCLARQNKPDLATGILQQLDEWLLSIDWITLAVEVKLMMAKLLFLQGKKDQALEKLKPALKLAETKGYCRVFIDIGEPMQALLAMAKERNIYTRYCSILLTDSIIKNPINTDGSFESLSQRELQVLKLLNSRLTIAEIADDVYVSVNTVKTHIKNIYSKLNVHSRNQAVQKAMELHLI